VALGMFSLRPSDIVDCRHRDARDAAAAQDLVSGSLPCSHPLERNLGAAAAAETGPRQLQDRLAVLHKLRRAMVNPDRSPLAGDIEIDETSVPFRKNSDPVDGGQGNSLIGKFKVIGAVELVDRFTPGRIRLEHIGQSDAASIWPFVLANTAPGCLMITDGNPAYVGVPDRTHRPNNLSKKNALPEHISMKWIHRVFANFKRWGLGTFHGFRDKLARRAQGSDLGYVRPDRLKRAKVIVAATGEDIFDVIAGLDLILETVSDSKVRGASQEIFALAGEKMTVVDDMLDELYRQLSDVDRMLEAYSKRE